MKALPEPFVVERGRGDPVLFLHGQPGLGRDWDAVAEELPDHRLLIVDRPGYGASGAGTLSIEDSATEFARLLVARGAAPATVVGHSYGGGIAILMAAHHPEVVSGLVLVASVGRADNVTVADRVLAAPVLGAWSSALGLFTLGRVLPYARRLAGDGGDKARRWWRATLPDSTYDVVTSPPGGQLWRTFVVEQRTLLAEIGTVEAALPAVHTPTAVLSGEWDVVVPPRVSDEVAAAIDGSELVRVPGNGHFIPRDAPDAVADAVRRVEARSAEERGPGTAAASVETVDDQRPT